MRIPRSLNLHVVGRLSVEDARRQERSAQEILDRFKHQPGVILGDEVGMGKTFVALAVAATQIFADPRRPVVVMAPRNVVAKWERDANTFRDACLHSPSERNQFLIKVADTGIDFLKLLDDPEPHRATLIVLAHGALHRRMADGWSKLAILQAAIKGRHNVASMRERLARFAPEILRMKGIVGYDLMQEMLHSSASSWKRILVRHGVLDDTANDPVPQLLLDTLDDLDLSDVYQRVVHVLPERSSKKINERLKDARRAITEESGGVLPPIWRSVLKHMRLSLPLLILDEAHRARHGGTQLASLLTTVREDLDVAGGQFAGKFDRMLFLTATPFQLGHSELCNILSRFEAIAWKGHRSPSMSRESFRDSLANLRTKLDEMHTATERLEHSWKQLLTVDVEEAEREYGSAWWKHGGFNDEVACLDVANERLRSVMLTYSKALAAIRASEARLAPWLLRSTRSQTLPPPFSDVPRRQRIEGAEVLAEIGADTGARPGGIRVSGVNTLPFLLSARVASLQIRRQLFSEGIASSYEALLDTHKETETEGTVAPGADNVITGDGQWHLERLREAVRGISTDGRSQHPKIRATIELAMSLWRRGEKVLIFCHYRQTGYALRRYLSDAMLGEIRERAARTLELDAVDVPAELARIAGHLDRDRPAGRHALGLIETILADINELAAPKTSSHISDIVLRFLRTPTFLVRFADLAATEKTELWVDAMFDRPDDSGMTLRSVLGEFFGFLANRCGESERDAYLEALSRVQTGSHVGTDAEASFGDDEALPEERSRLVANVRRVYGDTREETRARIMLTFNTPFYPEILISSSVLAEGVDLHLNCRHVIHHDLDWNPSSLEQRTGRLDRLGGKAERCGLPIRVYLPYVEGCQDEKLFRVVMDRERWFGVVMGAEASMAKVLNANAWEVERLAEQQLAPLAMVESLRMRLEPIINSSREHADCESHRPA